MADVVLKGVEKVYPGGVVAVRDVDLEIRHGEFMVILGPSGCGKSTMLRLIAGLEDLTSGTISIGGRTVDRVAPKDRDIAMVFQNYALYPHMTVYQNLAFGLRMRKLPRREIQARINETARVLGIHDLLDRKPKTLSGGQCQRVAVGRAIVRKPAVFLFDEPLSNLDARLRVDMRIELKKLHRRLGATMLYVTHDQVEAMTLADRIVIMDRGIVQQVASPRELYEEPVNQFVAGFLGTPTMNFIKGRLGQAPGGIVFWGDRGIRLPLPNRMSNRLAWHVDKPMVLGIRPEHIHVENRGTMERSHVHLKARVELVENLGDAQLVHLAIDGDKFVSKTDPRVAVRPDQEVEVFFNGQKIQMFDPATGRSITSRSGHCGPPDESRFRSTSTSPAGSESAEQPNCERSDQ